MSTWIIIGVLLAAIVLVLWLIFRSLNRWNLPPPTSEEGKQAEARLWSRRGFGER